VDASIFSSYYNIQSLDIVQEPRLAADKAAFEAVMIFAPLRKWELTNTRYLVGIAALLDLFNQQIDAAQKRLRVAVRFDLAEKTWKPRIVRSATDHDHLDHQWPVRRVRLHGRPATCQALRELEGQHE